MPDTTVRGNTWSITINNPIAADEENIAYARQRGWKVDGQLEQGESGTKHYQLIVKTPQIRFSAVKKQFPRAHIEQARNVAALEQYVHKEETKIGELVHDQQKYPSLQKVWDLFAEWIADHRLDLASETWGDATWLMRFDQFINDLIQEGYVVETIAVNPQVRACVKSFARSIIVRARKNLCAQGQKTDRQTSENVVSAVDQTDAVSETHVQEEEGAPEEETHQTPHGKTD